MIKLYVKNIDDLQQDFDLDSILQKLPSERQEKVKKLRHRDDKLRSIQVYLLLQEALSDWVGQNIEQAAMKYHSNGKPYLADYPGIYVSLSHSGDYVVTAIADEEIGIDIQMHKGYLERVAKRCLHTDEKRKLNHLKHLQDKEHLFYQIWTRKEAYYKYKNFSEGFEFDKYCVLKRRGVIFQDFELIPGYSLAVCSKRINRFHKRTKLQLTIK